ncbi:PilZ domain-containing protein [Vibrio quintilis]|nr:PilZ domain-containing protein [Vibrio quintilis]
MKELMPDLYMFGKVFRVSEISEGGIRVLMGESAITAQRTISGYIELHTAGKIFVKGKVLRQEKKEMVFALTEGPTFKDMLEEQRFLRQNHPALFPKKAGLVEY